MVGCVEEFEEVRQVGVVFYCVRNVGGVCVNSQATEKSLQYLSSSPVFFFFFFKWTKHSVW